MLTPRQHSFIPHSLQTVQWNNHQVYISFLSNIKDPLHTIFSVSLYIQTLPLYQQPFLCYPRELHPPLPQRLPHGDSLFRQVYRRHRPRSRVCSVRPSMKTNSGDTSSSFFPSLLCENHGSKLRIWESLAIIINVLVNNAHVLAQTQANMHHTAIPVRRSEDIRCMYDNCKYELKCSEYACTSSYMHSACAFTCTCKHTQKRQTVSHISAWTTQTNSLSCKQRLKMTGKHAKWYESR